MKIITQTIEQTLYVTDDGKMSFATEDQCLRYEQEKEDYKIINNLHSMKLRVPFLSEHGLTDSTFYLVRNKLERESIFRKWCGRYQYTYINGKIDGKISDIKVGDWVVRKYEYEGDERDYKGVYTLSYLVSELDKFFKEVDKITISGMY